MKKMLKSIYKKILFYMPKKIAHTILYIRVKHKMPDWNNPKSYDEMIHWLMVNQYDVSYGRYADKLKVREYVEECGCGNILVPLIKTYEKAEDIDFEELPDKFVLKTNHASGADFYYICKDKSLIDKEEIVRKFSKALKINFAQSVCEYQYDKIKPLIMCEAFLEESLDKRLDDYKVVCVNGVPKAILVCSDRDEGRDYFSPDWTYLEYTKPEYRSKTSIKKPNNLEEMLKIAEVLAKPFPLARVDFYIVNNKLYFGEITLTPSAGLHAYLNTLGQEQLAKGIILGKKK